MEFSESAQLMRCPTCQLDLPDDARYCIACGAALTAPIPSAAQNPATGPTQRLTPRSPRQADEGAVSADERRCLRCQVPLEVGFIPDRDGDRRTRLWWVAGTPQQYTRARRIVIDPATMWLLRAARCPRCGMVELYAPEQRRLNDDR